MRSCICDPSDETQGGEQGEDKGEKRGEGDDKDVDGAERRAKGACRASSPIVRTRWFFNASCEGCLEREAAARETPGDSH